MTNFESILHDLRQERDKLDKAIAALVSLDGNASASQSRRRTSKVGAASKARMVAAQKARTTRERSDKAPKAKRKFSAAGLARIRAAQKVRWAKVRAAKK